MEDRNFSTSATRRPVFDPNSPLETCLTGDDASSDSPLFGGETLLDARQVAAALNVSPSQLNEMIERGIGPPYFRFGKRLRRFLPSVVRAWAASRIEIVEPVVE